MPEAVPACSGGDICALVWWGVREETGESWADGSPHPIGQGASARGDGASSLLHHAEAATRFSPTEVWEARNPWLMEKVELAPDSCGPGTFRGGLGLDMFFHFFEDACVTSTVERTKNAPWGLGRAARLGANARASASPTDARCRSGRRPELDGSRRADRRALLRRGGGYGDPAERDPEAVRDLREGYITEAHAREHYPHAFEPSGLDEADTIPPPSDQSFETSLGADRIERKSEGDRPRTARPAHFTVPTPGAPRPRGRCAPRAGGLARPPPTRLERCPS